MKTLENQANKAHAASSSRVVRPVDALLKKIKAGRASVAVIGLGYVGLPLAVEMAGAGLDVAGIDINPVRVLKINSKESPIADIPSARLAAVVDGNKFQATVEISAVKDKDALIVCVPTPLTKMKTPDLSYVEHAIGEISRYFHEGQLLVLESTTYPGTTEEIILPILERTGLKVGQDFCLAFSPERVDPGNKTFNIKNTPKVVGGVTKDCGKTAEALYGLFVDQVIAVSSPKVAETTKLFENVFRNVNIALVHELAVLCDKMKINAWEVIEAASSKPFGFTRFNPGPGVGGHCIPIDPYYLAAKAKEFDFHSRFIELSGEINENRPYYVVGRIAEIINERSLSLRGANILILGVTYKKDIEDVRESPVVKIIEILKEQGANVFYNDPHVPKLSHNRLELTSTNLSEDFIRAMDGVVVGTDHSDFDYSLIVKYSSLIIDTRNCIKNGGKNQRVVHV